MKRGKGFTLIEILIVTSIIGLLVLMAFFLARNQYQKGRDARRKSDMHKIQEAAEEYEKDHDCYPPVELMVCNPGTGLTPYMSKIPCDLATGDSYYYENDSDTCAKWYRIFIFLDNQSDVSIIPSIGPGGIYNFYLSSPNAPIPASSSPTSSQTPSTPSCPHNYWGCISGVCTPISWKPGCTGPVCQPGYDNSSCNGQCGTPANPTNECVP